MLVRVSGVSFTYPRREDPVLRQVSFEVPSGAAVAIMGPSGSGKTTLLALMGGLLPLREGRVLAVDAHGQEHPVAAKATWVLQTVSLLPDRTAAHNVAVGAYSAGATPTEARERAAACLTAVGLAGREQAPARLLSGGEAQRVATARALASQRPIILADEPTGQLDAATSAVVIEALVTARSGQTVVLVTHDREVAARCDLVFELRDGVVRPAVGP